MIQVTKSSRLENLVDGQIQVRHYEPFCHVGLKVFALHYALMVVFHAY